MLSSSGSESYKTEVGGRDSVPAHLRSQQHYIHGRYCCSSILEEPPETRGSVHVPLYVEANYGQCYRAASVTSSQIKEADSNKTNSVALSPQANYTD
jgi:hypothetical protein